MPAATSTHKASPLRDRLLSNSPDPIKSSILRESGMGWNSPPSSESNGSGNTFVSPLRLKKRDKPVRPPLPDVHRRSSSSYRHLRNNNLVSKSPFKSQTPGPSSNTSQRPVTFPISPRKVSGEKRARPLSMHEQAEHENERPFALKRERKQSKTYQGLIQKEPVTKSPFRQDRGSDSDPPLPAMPDSTSPLPDSEPPPLWTEMEVESPNQLQSYTLRSPSKLPTPVSKTATPTRSSLVSKRLVGPRVSGRRERRKTVTWDECCDVVEISCGEEGSEDALDDASSDEEPFHGSEDHADPFFQGDQHEIHEENHSGDESYDSIPTSDDHPLELGPDTSISGLVDEMFGAQPSTPPRNVNDIPTDLETEDGVPFGRSHHADRLAQRKEDVISPIPIPFDPNTPPRTTSSTDPSPRQSHQQRWEAEGDTSHNGDYEDEDVSMLPESPSPMKPRKVASPTTSPMPMFRLSAGESPTTATSEDPFAIPALAEGSVRHDKDMDASFDISSLEKESIVEESHNETNELELSMASSHSPAGANAMISPRPLPTSRPQTPQSRHASPSMQARGSPTSIANRVRPRISREEIQRRLTRQRSSCSPSPMGSPSTHCNDKDALHPNQPLRESHEEEEKDRDTTSILTTVTDISAMSAEHATIQVAEKRIVDTAVAVVAAHTAHISDAEFGMLKPDDIEPLQFDFGSKFGRGLGLGLRDFESKDTAGATPSAPAAPLSPVHPDAPMEQHAQHEEQRAEVVSVDVNMDMRSALDRLMDDVSGHRLDPGDITMSTEGSDETCDVNSVPRIMERAATDSAVVLNAPPRGMLSRSASSSSLSTIPPPLPPKDNIRAREAMIIEKRRELRRQEEEAEAEFSGRRLPAPTRNLAVASGRPTRRRSKSTGDVDSPRMQTTHKDGGILDFGPHSPQDDDPLADSIEKELRKLEGPHKSKYLVRQHEETIYASSDNRRHVSGAGDLNAGKAWRTVRRPSDMNEYSKQIKEFRSQEKPGKAYGKVFVKVLGMRNMVAPIPSEPTAVTCTLNNGIHFVTTPEAKFGRDCAINQEFELIEHSKLEFSLTLKIRRDPHVIAQFKTLAPPRATPPPPPPVVQTSSKSGMRSFFSSSPKKSKDKLKAVAHPPQPQPQPQARHRMPENLARYLRPDGTLARAYVCFKDVAPRCDTRIFETAFPLIGQKLNDQNKSEPGEVGELVLQILRLPPLPGIAPDQLPQSLEECHRGLRHINWHKVTYFEGTLTQNGGDCVSWRRRQLRVIGSNLVSFNDVTKRATATISLKKAIAVEDDQAVRNSAISPASTSTSRSRYADDYDGLFGVERSFRLIFPDDEIVFFADTDEEKTRWLEVLRALVGHIPPHPLWAELLWQRQEELAKQARAARASQAQGIKKGPM